VCRGALRGVISASPLAARLKSYPDTNPEPSFAAGRGSPQNAEVVCWRSWRWESCGSAGLHLLQDEKILRKVIGIRKVQRIPRCAAAGMEEHGVLRLRKTALSAALLRKDDSDYGEQERGRSRLRRWECRLQRGPLVRGALRSVAADLHVPRADAVGYYLSPLRG
jgi:hypothetical protein